MFKASLIENQKYYKLKRKLLLIGIPSAILIGFIANFWEFPFLWFTVILVLTIGIMFIQNRIHKRISFFTNNRGIEIDDEFIRIKSKSGEIEEQINIDSVNKIVVKNNYSFPEENLKEIFREMKGDQLKNFIIINIGGQSKKFEFTMDSYYMIEQIKKVINHWQTKGINIQTVTQRYIH
jgi:hypothetical protein